MWLCVLAIVGVAVANLRGMRESGKIFAAPTYLFIASILGLVVCGCRWRDTGSMLPEAPYAPHPPGLEGISLFLLLRAFAVGCTALTGVEAVSDGVPAFKPPEAHNARIVLAWLGGILDGAVPRHHLSRLRSSASSPAADETVVSQLARQVFGGGFALLRDPGRHRR